MKNFKDEMAKELYGITLSDAHENCICVSCKKTMSKMTLEEIDAREWKISGLCPECFPTDFDEHHGK